MSFNLLRKTYNFVLFIVIKEMAQMENEVQGPSSVSDRVPWDPAGDRG